MADWGDLPPIQLNQDSGLPKYLQLVQAIEQQVRTGAIPSHSRLPSENDLDELLGLSRSTVRKALDELDRKGLVYRKQGQGTFVSPQRPAVELPGTLPARREEERKTGLIGLLVPSMMNEIYPQIVKGVEDAAATRGWDVFIGNTYSSRERELALMQQMLERNVDGLVLEPTHARFDKPGTRTFQFLKSFPRPFVLIDNDIPGLDASEVILDDFRGGELASRYLIDKGHRSIAYMYKETVLAALDRKSGFLSALKSAGIDPATAALCPYTEDDEPGNPGYHLTRQLLGRPDRPTAIFYFNDELAIHGIRAIRDAGLQIPRDISVMGFDNVASSAAPGVRLTTVEHPKYFCGRWAVDILFDQIDRGADRMRRRITIHPELVVRESVGSPRRN